MSDDDVLLAGDWNKWTYERPTVPHIACGEYRLAGDFLGEKKFDPTHKQRCLDYATVKGAMPVNRKYITGIEGDKGYHLVIYTYEVDRIHTKVWVLYIWLKQEERKE